MSRDIFSLWKDMVGLPDEFPELRPLENHDLVPKQKLYFNLKQSETADMIINHSAGQETIVLVNKGHGCTTLARYILQECERIAVRRKIMPVSLSLSDVDSSILDANEKNDSGVNDSAVMRAISERIREQIVLSLVVNSWQRTISESVYSRLLGATDGRTESQRLYLRGILFRAQLEGSTDWDQVQQVAPRLAVPLDELLILLAEEYSVSVSFQVDCSFKPLSGDPSSGYYQRAIRERDDIRPKLQRTLVAAVKGYREADAARPRPRLANALNELYFIEPEGWNRLHPLLGESRTIKYPPYYAADLFAMLHHHYRPRAGHVEQSLPLPSLIEPEVLEQYADVSVPITESIERFANGLMNEYTPDSARLSFTIRRDQRGATAKGD